MRFRMARFPEQPTMSVLKVHRRTVYRYRERVGLGEHRMMFRPRERHDLWLIRIDLAIAPQPAHLRWVHDPFDNSAPLPLLTGPRPNSASKGL